MAEGHQADAGDRILVLGPGAIGLGLSALCTQLGFQVGLIGRKGPVFVHAKVELADGVTRDFTWEKPSAEHIAATRLVMIAVKAFDLEAAMAAVPDISGLPKGTPVLSFVNGDVEGLVRKAAQQAVQQVWRLGFCNFGVSELGPQHVALRSKKGQAHFGPLLTGAADEIVPTPTPAEKTLLSSSPVFAWHNDIARPQRRKWLYNVVINSLSAARRFQRNGDLLSDLPMLAAVFAEALRLSVERFGRGTVVKDQLYAGLLELIEATEGNENSMARDRRLGRRTESDWLAGVALTAKDPTSYPLLLGLHREISTVSG